MLPARRRSPTRPHAQPTYRPALHRLHAAAVWSIRTLISLGTAQEPVGRHSPPYYTPASLAAMVACYLPLMGLSAALAIPGGLFMPSLLLGGSFGALCGLGLRATAPPGWHVQPGLYALCAATAVLGGVFRSSISVVVLVTESCGELASSLLSALAVAGGQQAAWGCACLLGGPPWVPAPPTVHPLLLTRSHVAPPAPAGTLAPLIGTIIAVRPPCRC